MPLRPLVIALALLTLTASTASADTTARFRSAVGQILAEPYQPDYLPSGDDAAFGDANVLNTFPAQDYTSGSIPGSPDAPNWPSSFVPVLFHSADGAPLLGELGLHATPAPGIVVVHGFNTHGYASVIRWAAMLYANGYDVLAADQRDFFFENSAGYGYPAWQQTFGWKESEDVLAAGRYLVAQHGVHGKPGLVGFSEGGQNTVLALALDRGQDLQGRHPVQRARRPGHADLLHRGAGRLPVALVHVSGDRRARRARRAPADGRVRSSCISGRALRHRGFGILSHETAAHAQTKITVPLLSFYSADDSLVPAFEAQMMAGYEVGNSLQRTLEVTRGEHAYFFDRWWQQRAILLYFKTMLSNDSNVSTTATVNQTAAHRGLLRFRSIARSANHGAWYLLPLTSARLSLGAPDSPAATVEKRA